MESLWAAFIESIPADTELVTVEVVYVVAIVLVGEGGGSKEPCKDSGELRTVNDELLVGVGEGGASNSELCGASKYACPVGVSGRSQGR